jgi:cell division protein FtsI/penicillin-binding protein 2
VACFLGVWMLVIGVRLIYLQTAQHEWLTSRARTQQQEAIETSPVRGLVLDRHGNELARSVDTESFWAVPREVRNVEEAAAQLAPLVGEDAGALASKLKLAQDSNKKFAWIARKLDEERASKVHALNIAASTRSRSRSVSTRTTNWPRTSSASSAWTRLGSRASSALTTRRFTASRAASPSRRTRTAAPTAASRWRRRAARRSC